MVKLKQNKLDTKKKLNKKLTNQKVKSKGGTLKKFEAAETFDEFLQTLDSDDDNEEQQQNEEGSEEEDNEFEFEEVQLNRKNKKNKKKVLKNGKQGGEDRKEEDEENSEDEGVSQHKDALKDLEVYDPEFFAYLKENDADLLNFDESEEEKDSDDDDEDENDVHKPSEDLEFASDSEGEEEQAIQAIKSTKDDQKQKKLQSYLKKRVVNLYVINYWEEKIQNTRDLAIFTDIIEAFDCGVRSILEGGENSSVKWKVEGSTNFNALARLCLKNIKGFCVRFISGTNNEAFALGKFDQKPYDVKEKSKLKWKKIRSKIGFYMSSIISFLTTMGSPEAIASVLRHCHKMSGFWSLLGSKGYKLIRTLIGIWSHGEDSCRIIAFMSIIRMANYNKDSYLLRCFKQMYISYVSNCKFTSVNSWAGINFMRNSLVELYLLDTELAYSTAFPFIRQLAIHLRNAVTAGTNKEQIKQKKSETSRIVYSWQFVHSLHLWADLLGHACENRDGNLKLLIYPVVQICLGTIKLIPTKKYIPLRFHVVRMLVNLQEKSKVFIPILPMIVEILHLSDFNPKSISKFAVRPLDLNCCLHADPSEGGYSKSVAEAIFDTLLRTLKVIASELSFPEIICPSLIQLKAFLKHKCKNPELSKKFKTLLEKIDANSTFVKEKRAKALENGQFSLQDLKSHQILRLQIENSSPPPPIITYANEYIKANEKIGRKIRKAKSLEASQTKEERMIPKISEMQKAGGDNKSSKKKNNKNLPDEALFASDSEDENETFHTKFDEDDDEDNIKSKGDDEDESSSKKGKKRKNKVEKEVKTIKKKKKVIKETPDDELVDFELSD